MRAAAKLVARCSRGRACVAWRQLPPVPHRVVRLGYTSACRELIGVHPSSQIGTACIADGVRIGPFCVLSDDAVIGANCELGAGVHVLGNTIIGPDCVVMSHAVIGSSDPGTTVVGRNTRVGAHAVVGAICEKRGTPAFASHLVIGDDCVIREQAVIHRSSGPASVTKIGNNVVVMGGVFVGHDVCVGDGAVVCRALAEGTNTTENEKGTETSTPLRATEDETKYPSESSPPPPKLKRTSPSALPGPEHLKRLNMVSLKALLQVRGLGTDGMKYLLVERLDANRDKTVNENSNAFAIASEASEIAWRVRDPNTAPACVCGDPCKEKNVRKEGTNKGKTFWACRRPKQAAPCGFFQWKTGTKAKTSATKKSMRAVVTTASPRQTTGPTVNVRGGSDMFEDLVIMSSSAKKRTHEVDAA